MASIERKQRTKRNNSIEQWPYVTAKKSGNGISGGDNGAASIAWQSAYISESGGGKHQANISESVAKASAAKIAKMNEISGK